MDTQLSFPSLVTVLRGAGFPGTPQDSFKIADGGGLFVPPELVLREQFGDLDAPVVLVSARGAAGKSRVAEELSQRLGSPLWKLERDKAVGATSLHYALGRYLEVADVPTAIEQHAGALVLIDSLDEARAWVSGTSWTDFLESIAETNRHDCRFVLFGRERTLEEVWLTLADAGVEASWVEISHFGQQERRDYVDGVVRYRSGPATLEGTYYTAARDAVLSSVVSSVSGPAAETFAGYPPVLDAVAAVLLREENHFAVSQHFGSQSQNPQHLAELKRVLERLLKRDQEKMKKLAEDLGLDPAAIYTPDEQLRWLCHELENGPIPDLSHITDLKLRQDYIDNIRTFVHDHPFRNDDRWASTVFAAYTAAQLFGTTISGRRLVEIGNDSNLLFDLVALQDEPVIDDWGFAALHASITAGEFSGALATVTASQASDGHYEVAMSITRGATPYEKTFILLPEEPQVLYLYGPIEGLTIETSGELRIPAGARSVVLGSDVFLHCRTLTIEGQSIEFAHRTGLANDSGETDGTVTLEVLEPGLHLPHTINREPLPGTFELRVPAGTRLNYPWVGYREDLELPHKLNANDRAVRFLKMLMNLTRAHGHRGERGAFIKKLQGRQALKDSDLRTAIEVLQEHGIVRIGGEMIYVREEAESRRFSGKAIQGQRQIEDVWDQWGPIVDEISARINHGG